MPAASPKELRQHMAEIFDWKTSPETGSKFFNLYTWWRDPEVVAGVGNLLAEPFRAAGPTVVIGPSASGYLTGVPAAESLGVGFCPIRKDAAQSFDSDPWVTVTSPPDYKDRHLELGLPKGLIQSGDRVFAVDDLIDSGGQLMAPATTHCGNWSDVGRGIGPDRQSQREPAEASPEPQVCFSYPRPLRRAKVACRSSSSAHCARPLRRVMEASQAAGTVARDTGSMENGVHRLTVAPSASSWVESNEDQQHERPVAFLDLRDDWRPKAVVDYLDRLLGVLPGDYDDGRVSLLVCAVCGDLWCGAVSMELALSPQTVTWQKIGWQGDPEDVEPQLLTDESFTFDRDEYEELLRGLREHYKKQAFIPPPLRFLRRVFGRGTAE